MKIRLDGLKIRHGQIVEFGELVARMDGLDVSTVPSPREGATTGDKRIQGQIQTGFARRVKQEFSFAIDVSRLDNGTFVILPIGLTVAWCWMPGRLVIVPHANPGFLMPTNILCLGPSGFCLKIIASI
jgi:hypothetical protein